MTRKIAKIAVLCILSCVVICAVAGALLFWRLLQGPVSLASFTGDIEHRINQQIGALKLDLGNATLELDPDTYVPTIRFQNVTLIDKDSKMVASAPRAAVVLDRQSLLSGVIQPVELELIGPSVRGRRNLAGGFELGIVGAALPESQSVEIESFEDDTGAKSDLGGAEPSPDTGNLPNVIPQLVELLSQGDGSSLGTFPDVRISRARVTLYDESNDSTWFAPQTELTFRRMPYGFVVLATADVASINEPWRAEVSATYRKDEQRFQVSARVANVVPANVAQQIYAFSQFARARIPLSGDIEVSLDGQGRVLSSSTKLIAGAGSVSFPDYFSQTITVDEGRIAFDYDPVAGNYSFGDSFLTVNGQKADLSGQVRPVWTADGRVEAYEVIMSAVNPAGTRYNEAKEELDVDAVDVAGTIFVEEQRLQIDDLVVRAGATGVRVNGEITAGSESAGIKLAGRLKDVPAPLLKRLWPPIMAPNTRAWINQNVKSGRIPEGTFHVNLPVDGIAQAIRNKRMPTGSANLQFELRDVRTSYFRTLPPIESATGRFKLIDNTFSMDVDTGSATLPTGEVMTLEQGTFSATDVLSDEVPGTFSFNVKSSLPALASFVKLPDIAGFVQASGIPNLSGQALVKVGLELPLIKNVPRERVKITTAVSLANVGMTNVVGGLDLSDGQFNVDFAGDHIEVKGPAKINGVDSKVVWRKPKASADAVIGVETVLDSGLRKQLGIKLDQFLDGPIPVNVALQQSGGTTRADVELDLSKVSLNVPALGWTRAATKGTRASFSLEQDEKGARHLKDIVLAGKGINLTGDVSLAQNGSLRAARLRDVVLADATYRSVAIEPGESGLNVAIEGSELDARPYIGRISQPAQANTAVRNSGLRFNVDARFDQVIAFRGENIRNAAARFTLDNGRMTSLALNGTHNSGQAIALKLSPTEAGRELKVTSGDGGATLRAADYYSKIAGGNLNFFAQIANAPGSPIRRGELEIRDFSVRDEAALAQLDRRGKPKRGEKRRDGLAFKRLTIPFRTDQQFVYLPDVELKGIELGAVAKGEIRKSTGALRIAGTIIPAQGISNVIDEIPLFGRILTGGKNEGLIGITFAMGGTIKQPKYQVNPLSAIAPGIFRKLFEFQLPKKKTQQSPY